MNCVWFTLERALYIYIGPPSAFTQNGTMALENHPAQRERITLPNERVAPCLTSAYHPASRACITRQHEHVSPCLRHCHVYYTRQLDSTFGKKFLILLASQGNDVETLLIKWKRDPNTCECRGQLVGIPSHRSNKQQYWHFIYERLS